MLSFVGRKLHQRNFVKYFAPTHEYVDVEGKTAKLGLSHFATHLLGDVTFVNVDTGRTVKAKEEIGNVEAAKAVSPIMAPLSLTVGELNQAIVDDPSLVGKDPEGKGWIATVTIADESELKDLMKLEEYEKFCKKH